MMLNSPKDIIFDNIVEQIKMKNNKSYECKILKEEINNDLNIKFIQLNIEEKQSNSFIMEINNENLIERKIRFDINSLKIKIINNIPFFLIKEYTILNEVNVIQNSHLLTNLNKNLYKIITSTKEVNNNYLYTLILKAKEVKVKSQHYKFILEDSNKSPVEIDEIENFEFENGKIYCFNGYIYDSLTLKFKPTYISYMEEFSSSILKIHNSSEISESKINSLINLKGKIKSFNITDNIIIIETDDKIEYKINANYNLIKQLILNNENRFYFFIKKSNKELSFTNLSMIEGKEETFINFHFPLYDSETKYYNKIKINNKYYDINNKYIKILIEDKDKSNLFSQKIFYEKIMDEKVLDSYSFDLDIEKGKIYNLNTSSEKYGFSYEIIIQSIYENNLPKNLKIKLNNEILDINPDKNFNKLKERFTIINFPEQNINKILGLSEKDDDKDDKHNNLKYLLLINANKEKILKKFEKINTDENIKKEFDISLEIENALEKASAQCDINYIEDYDNKLYNIDEKYIKIFSGLLDELKDGFLSFKFENSKRQYKIVKDIISFFINYHSDNFLGKYYIFRKNFIILLDSIINLEYIDRIKILITFMLKIMKDVGDKKVYYDMLHLIDLDNYKSYDKLPFVKDAFDIFYKIIDNLTEDCQLFQSINQFNNIIYKDIISGNDQHSGSILNINDIKLELIKNINRYIFLSEKPYIDCGDYANINYSILVPVIYMFSFTDDEFYIYDENTYERAKSAVLFLLFHECFGHQKKIINNENIKTPRIHQKSNFQDFSYEKIDTGNALEIILLEEIVNIRYLMNSKNSEKLLDPDLYTGKDFNRLKAIYASIVEDNINMGKNNPQSEDIKKPINENNNNELQRKLEIHGKPPKLLYSEVLKLYNEMNEEEREKLKVTEDYKRFLMIYERKYQRPSEYLKLPDYHSLRFSKKKKK